MVGRAPGRRALRVAGRGRQDHRLVLEEAERKSNEFLQKARDAGIKVVELNDAQMSAAKQIVYDKEWPKMESVVGKATMDKIRKIVGVK